MKVTINEANQLMGEVVKMIENRGGDLSSLRFEDYDDLMNLIHRRDEFRWDTHLQEWIKDED